MTDLVDRLRKSDGTYDITTIIDRCHEAADEIDRLHRDRIAGEAVITKLSFALKRDQAEIERLRGVLRWIEDHSNDPGVVREARAALGEPKP